MVITDHLSGGRAELFLMLLTLRIGYGPETFGGLKSLCVTGSNGLLLDV